MKKYKTDAQLSKIPQNLIHATTDYYGVRSRVLNCQKLNGDFFVPSFSYIPVLTFGSSILHLFARLMLQSHAQEKARYQDVVTREKPSRHVIFVISSCVGDVSLVVVVPLGMQIKDVN